MEYLLLGMGKSNLSIANFFENNRINYSWWDDSKEIIKEVTLKYPFLKNKVYETNDCYLNNHCNNFRRIVIVKSPGVRNEHPLLKITKLIITDLELYYLYNRNKKMITVTGTNGKSTCVTMIKHLIADIEMAGNIGIPLGDVINSNQENGIVIEASSYMLEYINLYHSKYNIILNLTPNHLDHHKTFERYIDSKVKLFKNCSTNDYIIYNYDDQIVRKVINQLSNQCHKIPISLKSKVEGIYILNDYIYLYERPIIHTSEIGNYETYYIDILASILCSYLYGVSIYDIRRALKSYQFLKFRLETEEINGITFVNDSKSTNIASTFSAYKSVRKNYPNKKIVLICGGEKRENVDIMCQLNEYFHDVRSIRLVISFGESREEFKRFFENKCAFIEYQSFKDIDENIFEISDVVVFSPGCPSFDEFENYQKRGEEFQKITEKIKKM